jgi:hypothetical protein
MKLIQWMFVGAGMAVLLLPQSGRAEGPNPTPDFKEVYDLIRAHLAGENETELNQAAVQGLLNQLHAKVSLVSTKSETSHPDDGPLLSRSVVYDGSIACLRIGRVGDGLAGKITAAYKKLAATNDLKGVVLDLRFADGHDYAEAAAVAGLFIPEETALLDWGRGMVHSSGKADAITLPVAVLVNQHTAAAAEALAAVLRQSAHALVLGAPTAGEATVGKEFPLKNGQSLRIATAGIKLADGESLSASGLKPDIEVAVKAEDEKVWYEDPFKDAAVSSISLTRPDGTSAGTTNRPARTRTTEADLMRERSEHPGFELEYGASGTLPDAPPEKPAIRDPVLGRALDLIKGISVMRQTRAP